ncbi:hypothetical protein MNBD_GAMMA10-2578 [hydrothermal vent metagenome]|uniref:Uncharacterized protein n=1 Tax=hydrothermal vent metagenome TaxID=652676 RepID=A0A3B0YDH3_9ZZZZ
MKKTLNNYGIEPGCWSYTFDATTIDWWKDNKQTEISIDVGHYEEDGSNEVLIWFRSSPEQRHLAYQSTFNEDTIKRTFVHHDIGKDKFHAFELSFDDEYNVWETNDYEDSTNMLESILSLTKGLATPSKTPGDPASFKAPPGGEHWAKFAEILSINSIGENTEEINELLMEMANVEGFDFIVELQKDFNSSALSIASPPSKSMTALVKDLNDKYWNLIFNDFKIEQSSEDIELSDLDLNILQAYILDIPDDKLASKSGLSEKSIQAARETVFDTLDIESKTDLMDQLSFGDYINLVHTT